MNCGSVKRLSKKVMNATSAGALADREALKKEKKEFHMLWPVNKTRHMQQVMNVPACHHLLVRICLSKPTQAKSLGGHNRLELLCLSKRRVILCWQDTD